MSLSRAQVARYSRQLLLPEIGVAGQERLARATVLLVGAGGLGSPAALYLAGAGVGHLILADPDPVELSNLHRQVLHGTARVGTPKVDSAAARLADLNPDVRVTGVALRLAAENAQRWVEAADVVLDGSDNPPTRYLVNDACVLAHRPLVHGGAIRFQGQVLAVQPGRSACLRCVFPEPPRPEQGASCQTEGILGACAGVIGSLMAQEALKLLLGLGRPLTDRLLVLDGLGGRVREVPVRRDPGCAVCGEHPTIQDLTGASEPYCVGAGQATEGPWPRSR